MRSNMRKTAIGFAIALLFILGCASRQPQVEAVLTQGEKTIDMKVSSYEFKPNNIKANQGDTIVLNITNISGSQHNFTIKDPGGKIIHNVELLPNKTEHVRITFTEKGTYDFYCDKPFHPTLGMKGRVEVGPGS